MRIVPGFVAVALLLLVPRAFGAPEPEGNFFFEKGDRVVFLGDSITEQYEYSTDIELYLTTRFPGWGLSFLNAGIGGDSAGGGKGRFAEHVLAEKPTAVLIDFGMNDGGYGAFKPDAAEQFARNTEAMLEAAQKAGVRVALISPNAVDRRVADRFTLYLETQKQFYAPLKGLASSHGAAFVDQYAATRAALEKMAGDDPKAEKVRPFGDGFHTSQPGGLLMAHAILVGLKAPALVSQADVDAGAGKAQARRCTVENVKATEAGVAFDRTDEALPMPVRKDWESVLPYVDDLKDLNWYGLKVSGLEAGKYTLEIDGKEVGSFTAERLNEGVNLGNLTTGPIYDQGQKVAEAIQAKNDVVHKRFRNVVMFQSPDWLADVARERKPLELVRQKEKIDAMQADVDKLARPQVRRFELKRAR